MRELGDRHREVDGPEDHHLRRRGEPLDVDAQLGTHHLARCAVAPDRGEALLQAPQRVARDSSLEPLDSAESTDGAVLGDGHHRARDLAIEHGGQGDRRAGEEVVADDVQRLASLIGELMYE